MLQSGFCDGFKAHWLGEEFHKVTSACSHPSCDRTPLLTMQKCADQSSAGQIQAEEKSNIPRQRVEFREMALDAEFMYLKACAAATESLKPLCKYGPMCQRLGNAELRAHHAHKYKHPGVALKVCVLGPPQCGKTQLCSLLEAKTQVHSMHQWLKSETWQLSNVLLRFPHLINQMFDAAEVFATNPTVSSTPQRTSPSPQSTNVSCVSEDLANCVVKSLFSSEQKNCGWILENFPRSVSQLKIMTEAGALPHCIVSIEVPLHEDSIAQDSIWDDRQEVLAELRRCGVPVVAVKSPDVSSERGMPDQRKKNELFELAWAGIESHMHSAAISPYDIAFPMQTEKRCISLRT